MHMEKVKKLENDGVYFRIGNLKSKINNIKEDMGNEKLRN